MPTIINYPFNIFYCLNCCFYSFFLYHAQQDFQDLAFLFPDLQLLKIQNRLSHSNNLLQQIVQQTPFQKQDIELFSKPPICFATHNLQVYLQVNAVHRKNPYIEQLLRDNCSQGFSRINREEHLSHQDFATAGNSIGAYSFEVPSALIAPVANNNITAFDIQRHYHRRYRPLIKVSAPTLTSSSIAIAAEGPPIPVEVTLTFHRQHNLYKSRILYYLQHAADYQNTVQF